MAKQGRGKEGRFAPKSDEPRQVRTVRLTDTAWKKLGEIATLRCITRADLLEEWAGQLSPQQQSQLELFTEDSPKNVSEGVIAHSTRKTGTELAHRLGVSSAALTNWLKSKQFVEKSQTRDPDGIAWEREPGTTKYRPAFQEGD